MSNPAMRGLLKIGSSSKDPTKHRVKELNTTGVPDPFKCEYYAFVGNFVNFEKAVHRNLSAQRYRANREFFRITVGPAIESFRLVSARMNEKIQLEWFHEGGSANRYNPKSKYSREQQAKKRDEWKAREDKAKRDRKILARNHLYEACKIGTEEEIEKAFSVFSHQPSFRNGEIKDQDGITPLHIVSLSNHSRALKSVLNYTPDTFVKDYLGQTPLHKAAQSWNDKNIKELIAAGSNIECQDSKGRRPLHFAAVDGNQKSVGRLLNHGADINAQDNKGSTPLHFAANLSLKSSVIRELIASGADFDLRDNFGRTPLHLAASTKRAFILKALLESGVEVDLVDNKGKTALHYAAIHGSEPAIKMLLAFGAWFKPKDIDGNTPKFYAQTNKELNKLEILDML